MLHTVELIFSHKSLMNASDSDLQGAVQELGLSPREAEFLREDSRLQCEYPGKFVAYFDDWTSVEGVNRLIRNVVASGEKIDEMESELEKYLLTQGDESRHEIEKLLVE